MSIKINNQQNKTTKIGEVDAVCSLIVVIIFITQSKLCLLSLMITILIMRLEV